MDHKSEFLKRKTEPVDEIDLLFFGWFDAAGQGGDYGLNLPPAEKTFTTLITTTYMFQPEPKFSLFAAPVRLSPEQFEYLQEHDLDTQAFLGELGISLEAELTLDLGLYEEASAALEALSGLLS